ncbi:MAG: cupin domain-containing protein [Candidatus Limnocylindrales bacterium]
MAGTPEALLDELVAAGLPEAARARATWTSWSNGPGDTYAVHVHSYDKVLLATAGSITFRLPKGGQTVLLAAGERLELPAGMDHAAVVGPAGVACLELHLPAGSLAAEQRRPFQGGRETARSQEA